MKKIIALIIILIIIQLEGLLASPVQPVDSVSVKWQAGKKYIEYKVKEHEGWFGIARQFGISYNELRIINNKDTSEMLSVGHVILVPVQKRKVTDNGNKIHSDIEKNEKDPVYYVVKQKETLYTISKKYKVTANEIKKWNHLTSGNLKKGEKIIVGFKTIVSERIDATQETGKPVINVAKKSAVENKKHVIEKPDIKSDSSVVVKTASENKIFNDSLHASNKTFIGKVRREVSEQGVATWIEDENINPHKYFALHRVAIAGSIIKVTNKMNRRSIFVKVVGKLPESGDNENIIIKISKASAEKLGVRDQRFQCELAYGVYEK